jgi:hypothetical protein
MVEAKGRSRQPLPFPYFNYFDYGKMSFEASPFLPTFYTFYLWFEAAPFSLHFNQIDEPKAVQGSPFHSPISTILL